MTPERIIVGLGTGRCGTTSLHRLLRLQPGTQSTHEFFGPEHRWECGPDEKRDRILRWIASAEKPVLADVSFAWLPYVGAILGVCSELKVPVRFLCLQRPVDGYVESMRKWLRGRNHFVRDPEGCGYLPCGQGWGGCYPKFHPSGSVEGDIRAYWNLYTSSAATLANSFAGFRIFPTGDLNSARKVREMLLYLGYEDGEMAVEAGIKTNTSQGLR